uniref:T9SS type A sorting domain-containing protein n=1 Tax=candidate division WOR-3 bacterium TaxID=2052148 RepID=A0A7C4TES9_UNCW3
MGYLKSLFFLFIPFFAYATITFEKSYGGPSTGHCGLMVEKNIDGGYTILAQKGTGANGIYFLKVDSLGNILWVHEYEPFYASNRISYSFKTFSEGYILVGYRDTTHYINPNLCLLRTNQTGDSIWQKLHGGDSLDIGYWIEITPDSNFIIAGETKSYGLGSSDAWLIKTDTAGNIIWTRTFGGVSYDVARCVKNTPDKGFIILSSTYSSGAGFSDIWLLKADSLGNLEWSKTYGGECYEWGYEVEVLNNGYIIIGQTNSFGWNYAQDVYLIRTDSSGDTLWTKTFDNCSDDDVGYSIACTWDNGFVLAGYTTPQVLSDKDIWLIKIDSTGNILWQRTFGGVKDDGAYSIETTSDSGFIIAGYTFSQPTDTIYSEIYLIKTDFLGNVYGIEERKFDFGIKNIELKIYPSVVRNSISIEWTLKKPARIELSIYDAAGSKVKAIRETDIPIYHNKEFIDLRDLACGVYFMVLKQNNEAVSKKFILIK